MSVAVLHEGGYSCMYDTVTMWAFGGIFYDPENAYEFIEWLQDTYNEDPRQLSDNELENRISIWRNLLQNLK